MQNFQTLKQNISAKLVSNILEKLKNVFLSYHEIILLNPLTLYVCVVGGITINVAHTSILNTILSVPSYGLLGYIIGEFHFQKVKENIEKRIKESELHEQAFEKFKKRAITSGPIVSPYFIRKRKV